MKKFKIGDKVRIINRDPSNTTGSPQWYRNIGDSIGIECYICQNSHLSYCLRENKNSTGEYYGLLSKEYSKDQFNECDLELVNKELQYEIY